MFPETMDMPRPITAPDRAVCQHTGEIAEDILSVPALFTMAERDQLIKERDDARAELDNMVNLAIEVGRLGNYLKHAIADRDEYRESSDEWRDMYYGAQCRMDEMAAEISELRGKLTEVQGERDTARAGAIR